MRGSQFWKIFKQTFVFLFRLSAGLVFLSTAYIFSEYANDFNGKTDCAVIFGAAVWRNNIPSHALYDRTVATASLYNNRQVDCIVASGGPSAYGAHEVEVMVQLLQTQDVPLDIIMLDYGGINTISTLQNLSPEKQFVFVSNDFHLARIQLLAWRLGIKSFSLHASDYNFGRYSREWYFFLREIAANLVYGIKKI